MEENHRDRVARIMWPRREDFERAIKARLDSETAESGQQGLAIAMAASQYE